MSKKQTETKDRRINAVAASKESYFAVHWFLMYEDKYRKLSPKAKLLYGMLRSRYALSNLTVNSGSKDADSFIDKEGKIFCIFDNTELAFLNGVSVPTIIEAKKELVEAGLLEEVPVKDQANRLYVLEPVLDSDMWTFKQQLADIKAEKAKKDEERKRKQREKRQKEAAEKRAAKEAAKKGISFNIENVPSEKNEEKMCDSNNLNHTQKPLSDDFCDSNNLNHVTKDFLENITRVLNLLELKDFSKYVGKDDAQSVIEFYKTFFDLTKYAEIQLNKFMKEHSPILVLEAVYRAIKNAKHPISFIQGTLNKWSAANCKTVDDINTYEQNFREDQQKAKEAKKPTATRKTKAVRKEMVPDWLDNQNQNDVGQADDVNHEQLKEMAEWYKQGERNFPAETISEMLAHGYLSAEELDV